MINHVVFEVFNVGKHQGLKDSAFDKKQLKQGIDIEKEHTDNKQLSKEIAKDHLAEIPDYYTRLIDMEKKAKREGKYKPILR